MLIKSIKNLTKFVIPKNLIMTFENTSFFKDFKSLKVEMPFGNFYLCEKFFISEIHETIHFDWEMIQKIMTKVIDFYGENCKIGYISNRINSYSINPKTWDTVDKEYGVIVAGAVVTYNPIAFMNATLEKQFYERSIKRCSSLEEAIYWITNLKELN
jgi:hypothetical protein